MMRKTTSDVNITGMFPAKAVGRGCVIRRNVDWADDQIGRDRLFAEVERRGFQVA